MSYSLLAYKRRTSDAWQVRYVNDLCALPRTPSWHVNNACNRRWALQLVTLVDNAATLFLHVSTFASLPQKAMYTFSHLQKVDGLPTDVHVHTTTRASADASHCCILKPKQDVTQLAT